MEEELKDSEVPVSYTNFDEVQESYAEIIDSIRPKIYNPHSQDYQSINLIPSSGKSPSKKIFQLDKGHKVTLDDFFFLKNLGAGAFGKVQLYILSKTGQLYAFKSLRKDKILEAGLLEPTKLEKDILSNAGHPFIASLEFVFQTDERILFAMRFFPGGELRRHLMTVRTFSEYRTKFYVA